MTHRFDWEANGLDRARFEALTKLLRLRYHGQVEPPCRFDELQDVSTDDDAVLDDVDSTKAVTLTDFDPDRLRRVFLDRLAELVANEKGGRHVAATMMVHDQDRVEVFVARNNTFRPNDVSFLPQTEALLRLIARGTGSVDGVGRDSSKLWEVLLEHYETRIQGYIVDLRQRLKRCFPPAAPNSQSQAVESSLVSHLRGLRDSAFAQYPSTTIRNETLVLQAHVIFKSFTVEDFGTLPFSGWQDLRNSLGFLAGLQSAFRVLIRAAERLPNFESINISIVMLPANTNAIAKKGEVDAGGWTLAQAFEHLGHTLTDDQIHILIGSLGKKSRWTRNKLLQKFNKLKSSTWEVHAEMQLLPSYIRAMATNDSVFRYIGCSRNSCFLCWHFLDLFANIKTRGCHGKLYHCWGLPDFEGLTTVQIQQVVASVQDVEGLVKRQLLDRDARILRQAKESTVGESSIETAIPGPRQPSMAKMVLEYLNKQRASLLFPSENAEEPQCEEAAGTSVIDEPNNSAIPISGPCGDIDCVKTTARRCSHCGGPWFCSTRCEENATYSHNFTCNRRPITTADLLEKDCYWDLLPEDPKVREDYGFQRCRNRSEETNLFGLYIGVIKYLDVSSEELHRWSTEGILADKIVEVFSKLPVGSRGGYYPWFLRNRHILEGEQEVKRDEDDVSKYIQERHAEARAYLEPADQTKAVEDLTPCAKRYCFIFFSMLLDSKHPPPMAYVDLWYDFGYVCCSDIHAESGLSQCYQRLLLGNKLGIDHLQSLRMELPKIPTCSFTDFWKAWEVGSLSELFSKYGIDHGFSAMREFLSSPGKSRRPSVWRLKHFLAIEDANVLMVAPEIAAAAMEYGFYPRLDTRTRLDLHDFYTRVFRRGVLPREIDEARRKRNMHEMAERWRGGDVSEGVKRVLNGVPYVVAVDI